MASRACTTTTINKKNNMVRTTTTRTTTAALTACSLLLSLLVVVVLPGGASGALPVTHGGDRESSPPIKLSQVDGKSLFRSLRASSCSVDCSQEDSEPVCGTDGVTYASRCELQRAKQCDNKRAQGQRIKVRSKGRCPGDTEVVSKCFQEREEARKSARRDSDVLIPSCNPDGTYNEVQCHTATQYCWCVTKDGRHIPGTSTQDRRPRCKGGRRRKRKGRSGKRKKKRKACASKERQTFNTELVNVFREEYERMLAATGPDAGGEYASTPNRPLQKDAAPSDDDVSIEKKIVIWKFSQLDTNKDSVLSFKEIRSFRRMVKKLIKPRRCAKRFHRYCDKDNNRRIEKTEWTLCLGVDIKQGHDTETSQDKTRNDPLLRPFPPVLRPPSDLPSLSSHPVAAASGRKNRTDSTGNRNCLEERQAAIAQSREEPSANIYIPRCQPSGLWRQAQCHEATEYCWCVSEDTGIPIPGTSTFKVEPNCTIRDHRQMKGCPFEQKRRFIVDLMSDLTQEMVASNQSAQDQDSDGLSQRERVARWKLETLDKNKNGILERQEWRNLRKTLKKNKEYPRKCRRQFLRYCDENNDKALSLEEWRDCLGLNHNLFNSLPQNPKRKGQKNPFMDQLT